MLFAADSPDPASYSDFQSFFASTWSLFAYATFRKDFLAAGTNRDAAALRRFYTDDFTHTHTSGKVDGKEARNVSVMAGEPTVEMAPIPEFRLSCFGEAVCIARAQSD